jgi:hypothetical protein
MFMIALLLAALIAAIGWYVGSFFGTYRLPACIATSAALMLLLRKMLLKMS